MPKQGTLFPARNLSSSWHEFQLRHVVERETNILPALVSSPANRRREQEDTTWPSFRYILRQTVLAVFPLTTSCHDYSTHTQTHKLTITNFLAANIRCLMKDIQCLARCIECVRCLPKEMRVWLLEVRADYVSLYQHVYSFCIFSLCHTHTRVHTHITLSQLFMATAQSLSANWPGPGDSNIPAVQIPNPRIFLSRWPLCEIWPRFSQFLATSCVSHLVS